MISSIVYFTLIFAQSGESLTQDAAIKLAQDNCIKCMNSSINELEKAVEALEYLMAAGQLDPKARRTLADAYGQLAYGAYEDESAERQQFSQRQQAVYRDLVENECFDPETQLRYALSLDRNETMASLEPILEMQTFLFQAAWTKAGILLANSDTRSDGQAALKRAVALATDVDKVRWEMALSSLLVENQLGDLAAKLEADVRQIRGD